MTDETAVEAAGLVKSYGDVRVLHGVDLRVARGSVFALLGPNGAGKTTTVRILCTLAAAGRGAGARRRPRRRRRRRARAAQHQPDRAVRRARRRCRPARRTSA